MMVDGRMLAEEILTKLEVTVGVLKKKGVTPTIAVILIGDNSSSLSFIRQKQKAAERIGAKLIFEHLPDTTTQETLESAIVHYNTDPLVHGLIIQRPLPVRLPKEQETLNLVAPQKDIDGFIPHSPFEVPVARGVMFILANIHKNLESAKLAPSSFKLWLKRQVIAVIGKGVTAGGPIAATLKTYGNMPSVIDSHSADPQKIIKNATVIISCVGKPHMVTKKMIQTGTVLISVGLSRDINGKSHGDYEVEDISGIASFYTPTPGGVGPVNVACLMQNLVDACILQLGGTT